MNSEVYLVNYCKRVFKREGGTIQSLSIFSNKFKDAFLGQLEVTSILKLQAGLGYFCFQQILLTNDKLSLK